MGHQLWGGKVNRRFFSDSHWKEPLLWNEEAKSAGRRERVFCASMADVFERKAELRIHRLRLWALIEQTPSLDWLLLTKRPQNIEEMVPWKDNWPQNVWLGTTVENETYAQRRLPLLLKHPAAIRFLSCEPLLGPINLRPWMKREGLHPINWVIAGGESGFHPRPMHPDWAKSLLDQCREAKVAFHFKQWGHWAPAEILGPEARPQVVSLLNERPVKMVRVSKKAAGRLLEGTTWDGVPEVAAMHG